MPNGHCPGLNRHQVAYEQFLCFQVCHVRGGDKSVWLLSSCKQVRKMNTSYTPLLYSKTGFTGVHINFLFLL